MNELRVNAILAVDDVNPFSVPIRHALSRRGFEILCAKSPAKGLAAFQAHLARLCLVAIDMAAPSEGNLDLSAELARLRPALPILYLVGAQKSIARCSIEAHSPRAVLAAPFTEEEIVERLSGLLQVDIAARRAPEERQWERIMAASDSTPPGAAILHVYQPRQAGLAADHIAILRASQVQHSVRPTNCEAAPYGIIVRARDVARAHGLLAGSNGSQFVSAA